MKTFTKLAVIYIIAVLGYAVFTAYFTIPVHLGVDEELYISMARSFHYEGVFSKDGQILNYSCVLYSMLLSLAYFLYRTEHIMFALRMIGVLVMLSSIFPIYLLGKEITGGRKQLALKLAAFACLLPTMMDTAYCMQEVLSYPLFLWLIYLVYLEIKSNKVNDVSWHMFLIVFIGVLCYFTKTYMIFFPVIYCIFIVLNAFLEKKNVWKKLVLYLGSYVGLYFICKQIILYINNGIEGTNHYAGQFSRLFPITGRTIISAASCMVFYIVALTFYTGVLPPILLMFNFEKYDENNRRFMFFVFGALFVIAAEIVISIVLTEEGNVFAPRKFYWRYLQIFEIPLILMFIEKYKDMQIPPWIWKVYVAVFGYLGVYYLYIGDRQKTAIIDAPVFLLMENISKYIIPNFNILACVGGALVVILAYILKRTGRIKSITRSFVGLSCACVIMLFLINLFQLPYYTNVIANGSAIEEDAIKIVDYWENHKEILDKVYFINTEQAGYEGNIYAYFPVEVYTISDNETATIEEDSLIILPKSSEVSIDTEELNLGLEALRAMVTE